MKYYPAVVTSREQLARLVVAYSEFDHFAVDLETIGTRESRAAAKTKDVPALDEMTNQVLWIGMAGPGRVDCIPLGHPEGPVQLRRSEVLSALKPLFFSNRLKINQNIKFDILTLAKYWGEIPPGPYLDTGTLVHIFNENLREYNLGYLVEHYLGFSYRKLAKEGTPMDKFPFWDVALYAGLDAKLALLLYQKIWGKISDKETLKNVLYLEMGVTEVLMWAKQRGICFNKLKIQELDTVLGQQLTKLSEDIYAAAGRKFLITSDQQKAVILYGPKDEGALGLPCKIMTPGGKVGKPQRSTSKRALQAISSKHPIVPMLMRHAELSKLKSAFTTGLAPHVEDDGRVRASLKQSGTVTGRFSCVAGDTVLVTSRGNFRFDEYIPLIGDKVPTHTGEWKPVLRKILKGLDTMYRVCLDNGAELSCTSAHRILTPKGWEYIRYLNPGDEVCTYDGFSELCEQSSTYKESSGVVSIGQQTNCCGSSYSVGNHDSQCSTYFKDQYPPRAFESRTSSEIFSLKEGREESDDWKEWFPASQLEGGNFGWSRLFAGEDRRKIYSGSSYSDGESGRDRNTARVSGTSYRRESLQQRFGQSSIGDTRSSPKATRQETSAIRAIYSLGRMEVWDVEVEDSHSYSTQGFFNHNCTSPNLQQIPRQNNADDDGARIRSMFEAGPGYVLVVGDYAQVEARFMGHFAGPLVKSSNLIKAFTTDIDFHTLTAAGLFGKPLAAITKEERQAGKTANFLLIFGGSPDRLIETGGYPKRVAELMHKGFHETYPEINKYANEVARRCHAMNTPYTETILGRRRRLPEINHIQGGKWIVARAERQAMNHIIQGSAADVNKMAMVRAHNLIKERWSLDTWRVILTVHDEIILEVPERYAEQGIELLKEAMEQVEVKLRVPLVADVHSGLTWSAAK